MGNESGFDTEAVVGILQQEERLLVIRRSARVIAPLKLCFPGGKKEPEESMEVTLVREFDEEVGLAVTPINQIWTSITPWRCRVHWWNVECSDTSALKINLDEACEVCWLTPSELLDCEDLLESNRHFLDRVVGGEISL